MFVAENFDARRRLNVAEVDGFAQFEAGDIHDQLLRQILGQGAHLEFEKHVFQHAATVFRYTGRFAGGFQRHHDDDLFTLGHFMEIHVEHIAVQRVVLDFLDQGEAFGPRVAFDGQVHQEIFRGGMVDEVAGIPWR